MASKLGGTSGSNGLDLSSLLSGVSSGGLGTAVSTPVAAPLPSTSDATRDTTATSSKAGTTNTATTGTSNTATKKKLDKQNMDAASLQALIANITNLAAGGDGVLAGIDAARQKGITDTQALIAGQDPNAAVARAGGRTADLSRQLNEGALATLMGGDEAGGFGGNALSQLLAQDAAVRTAEAQARVEEDAYNSAVGSQLSGTNVLNSLLGGGSAVQNSLMEALGIAKGAVETGTETGTSDTVDNQVGTSATTETGKTTTNEAATSSSVDPVEWAKIMAQLQIAANAKPTEPTDMEKALAMFQAGGGNTISALSAGRNVGSTGVGNQYAQMQSDALNQLLRKLGG